MINVPFLINKPFEYYIVVCILQSTHRELHLVVYKCPLDYNNFRQLDRTVIQIE